MSNELLQVSLVPPFLMLQVTQGWQPFETFIMYQTVSFIVHGGHIHLDNEFVNLDIDKLRPSSNQSMREIFQRQNYSLANKTILLILLYLLWTESLGIISH